MDATARTSASIFTQNCRGDHTAMAANAIMMPIRTNVQSVSCSMGVLLPRACDANRFEEIMRASRHKFAVLFKTKTKNSHFFADIIERHFRRKQRRHGLSRRRFNAHDNADWYRQLRAHAVHAEQVDIHRIFSGNDAPPSTLLKIDIQRVLIEGAKVVAHEVKHEGSLI